MANAKIEVVGPGEYTLLADLYNQIFRPSENAEFFNRRLDGRRNVVTMIAHLDDKPVGLCCGYELRPTTFYCWLCGVISDARRMGVATQLMAAHQAWAKEHHYDMMRQECHNQHRSILHLALRDGFDIVGIRWDTRSASNLVILEKHLVDE